ncbi:hypothetical protein J6590_077332 [Homalodisca vitripennis]|nr:hypothetical protein J6590_077332 [Homalodisca vitripennis]
MSSERVPAWAFRGPWGVSGWSARESHTLCANAFPQRKWPMKMGNTHKAEKGIGVSFKKNLTEIEQHKHD